MDKVRELLDQLVRRQRSKLTAQLVKRFGYQHLNMIEDAIQDAILKALERWEYDGLPEQAEAWLYRVAHNRAVDLLRKMAPEVAYADELDQRTAQTDPHPDAELALLFKCCHPALKTIEQQLLMLNLVIGLDHSEIANLLLISKDAVSQRLARAKRKTRAFGTSLDSAQDWQPEHIESVITVIYTSFCVGYFPRQGQLLTRRDIAFETLRLTNALLTHGPQEPNQKSQLFALGALMSFQCSRFDTRTDATGAVLLLDQQDQSKWDQELIRQGQVMLKNAQQSNGLSEFHVEAAIAALHLNPEHTDWQTISSLHEALLKLRSSPGRVIAAAIAMAYNQKPDQALKLLSELDQNKMASYVPYHLARAEIHKRLGNKIEADQALYEATMTSKSAPIESLIEQQLI